jgi:hypothetical protein
MCVMESILGFLGLQKPAISSHIHRPTQCGAIEDTIFLIILSADLTIVTMW